MEGPDDSERENTEGWPSVSVFGVTEADPHRRESRPPQAREPIQRLVFYSSEGRKDKLTSLASGKELLNAPFQD